MQRALQAQSSFDMRPRRADEFQKGRPTAPAIPRVKQMAQFFQSKQVKSMQRNSDKYLELPTPQLFCKHSLVPFPFTVWTFDDYDFLYMDMMLNQN